MEHCTETGKLHSLEKFPTLLVNDEEIKDLSTPNLLVNDKEIKDLSTTPMPSIIAL